MLNVSRHQVYALVRGRSIFAVKIDGRGQWRVERNQLKAYTTRLYREVAHDPHDLPGPTASLVLDTLGPVPDNAPTERGSAS